MKRLPKKITNEIREILEGCRDGKLKHDQTSYHCGTSHCIAGWKAVRDFAKAKNDQSLLECNFEAKDEYLDELESFLEEIAATNDEWLYAKKQWQLTANESIVFFDYKKTYREQFALLETLERGERVE
jgi:hypothetical protein